MSLKDCRIIQLPKITDGRGSLTFIEGGEHIPFEIGRVFYLYDVAGIRGAHAHKSLHQFLICLAGSLQVLVDDGVKEGLWHLHCAWEGLHIPPMIWSEINFAAGSICLVLCSEKYDEADYIRDYQEFLGEC